jgi:RPA family protein
LEPLLEIEPPEMIAVVGKVRIFEGETRNFVSIRPEYIAVVDSEVRDYWVYETAKRTLERIERMETNRDDSDIALAWQIYNPDLNEYRDVVRQALLTIREEFEIFEGKEEEEEKEEEKEIEDVGDIDELEDIERLEEEFEFEEEEWDLSDILGD